MQYAIEVTRLAATVVGADGARLAATFFLRTASQHHTGCETLGDRLNDPGTDFLAVETDHGIELVQLQWILYVEHEGTLPEVATRLEVGAERARVRLALTSGETLEGELCYLLPEGRNRLSDLLNTPAERFLLLLGEGVTRYVNRRGVTRLLSLGGA